MNIYVAHSTNFDFKKELYKPISELKFEKDINIIFPHVDETFHDSKQIIFDRLGIIIAEVSYPSTGLGIELGWANIAKVPVYFIYKSGMKYSSSLNAISTKFYSYNNAEELQLVFSSIVSDSKIS